VSRPPLKMRFFRDAGVRSVLEDPKQLRWDQLSSCIIHTLRFCARIFLVLPKKSLFLEAPLGPLRGIALLIIIFPLAVVQAEEIQDPMQPPAFALEKFRLAKLKNRIKTVKTGVKVKKPVVKPLRLTSILYSSGRKIAIIDNRMLRVGDTIRSARLIRINRHSARLLKKGKIIELKLSSDFSAIKKTPSESRL
jgi:hypothetical protein